MVGRSSDCSDKELERARRALRARDLPGADAARRRPGPAVPVHLRACRSGSACSCATRRRPRSASRASRCPSSCRASSGSASAQLYLPLEHVIAHSLTLALPEDGDHRVRPVPGHARRRLRGLGRGGRPARGGRARAAPPALRRHRARSRSPSRCRTRCSRASGPGSEPRRIRSTAIEGLLDLADAGPARRPRPPRSQGRAVAARHAAPARRADDRRRALRRDPPRATSSSTCPTSRSRRASRRSSRPRRATRT